jgi:hypothetical protein
LGKRHQVVLNKRQLSVSGLLLNTGRERWLLLFYGFMVSQDFQTDRDACLKKV